MRFTLLISVVLLCATLVAPRSAAQTTNVSFSVIDADGQSWNNGTWTAQLTSPPGVPSQQYIVCGTTTVVPNQQQSGTLDATGNGSLTLTPNTSICPTGTVWTFVFLPQATPTASFQAAFTVDGPTQVLTVTPPGIRVSLTNPATRALAYSDLEITGADIGATYFNLISQTLVVCTVAPCTTFTSLGSSIISNCPQTSDGVTLTINCGLSTPGPIVETGISCTTCGLSMAGPGGVLPGTGMGAGGFGIGPGGVAQFSSNGGFWFALPYPPTRLIADSAPVVATTAATAVTLFSFSTTVQASTTYTLHCAGSYIQSTGNAAIGVAVQGTINAPVYLRANALIGLSTTTTGSGDSGDITNTTYTQVANPTGAAFGTILPFTIDGVVEVGPFVPIINVGFFTGNASDGIVIKRGSTCALQQTAN